MHQLGLGMWGITCRSYRLNGSDSDTSADSDWGLAPGQRASVTQDSRINDPYFQ